MFLQRELKKGQKNPVLMCYYDSIEADNTKNKIVEPATELDTSLSIICKDGSRAAMSDEVAAAVKRLLGIRLTKPCLYYERYPAYPYTPFDVLELHIAEQWDHWCTLGVRAVSQLDPTYI